MVGNAPGHPPGRRLEEFLADSGRETRTALALILGPAERLLAEGRLAPEERHDLEVVCQTARSLGNHLADLHDLARVAAGGLELHYARTDLARLLRVSAAQFDAAAREHRVALSVAAPENVPVEADPEKLQRALIHLLVHAFRSLPGGGVLNCVLEATGQRAVIRIHCDGPGPGLGAGPGLAGPGEGPGLAIAAALIEGHQGALVRGPAPESGTLVQIELPLAAPPGVPVAGPAATAAREEAAPAQAGRQAAAGLVLPGPAPAAPRAEAELPLVLIVEDNPIMNRFIAAALGQRYRTASALDGQQGLELALALRPDLIVSDVVMPGLGLAQFLQALRAHRELDGIPVIVLSGKADEAFRAEVLRSGAQDYLVKPFSTAELDARVGNLVELKRARDVLQRELASRSQDLAALANEVALRRREQAFLAEAGKVLASSLDHQTTLEAVVRLAIPFLAGWCAVYLIGDDQHLHPVVTAHADPDREAVAWEMLRRYPRPQLRAENALHLLRTGEPWLVPEVTEAVLAAVADNEEHLRMLRALGLTSSMVTPLVARGRTLGILAFGATGPDRRYGEADVAVARQLADRAALAVDNARIHTERRHIAEALRESNDRLKAVVQASPFPIISQSRDGTVETWNHAAEQVFGWAAAEVIGRPVPTIPAARKDEVRRMLETIWQGGGVARLVTRQQRRDGSLRDVSMHSAPLHDEAGQVRGVLSVVADISDRVRFLQVAAHELRNPMAGVKSLLALMRRWLAAGKPVGDIVRLAAALESEVDRLAHLVDEILEAFRAQEGHLEFRPEPVDLAQVVTSVLESFRLAEGRARFRQSGLEHGPVWVQGDAGRLSQVFSNLLSNAVKYSPGGGEVRVALDPRDGQVLVTVADDGYGIPGEQLSRVFEPFFRASNLQGRDPGGMGLGLYLCRDIVLRHQGRIWVESAEGQGATFYVLLPLGPPATGT